MNNNENFSIVFFTDGCLFRLLFPVGNIISKGTDASSSFDHARSYCEGHNNVSPDESLHLPESPHIHIYICILNSLA